MSSSAGDLLESRRGAASVAAVIVVFFLALRIALLLARDPFFDELFTLWIAAKPWSEIVGALRHDSGPPLYYFLVKPFAALAGSVAGIRLFSLAAATTALVLILAAKQLGPARFTAAALLAIHPPSVLFATDARSYALCALLVLAGVLLLESDRPFPAALALVAAAYCHYYGALFLPVLLLKKKRGALALAVASVLFVPGLLLAWSQPAQAMRWADGQQSMAAGSGLLFLGRYPASLLLQDLWLPVVIAFAVALVALSTRVWRFAPYVMIPVALAVALALAGRNVYFPMRFESVLAAPLALWMATSLHARSPSVRTVVVGALIVTSTVVLLRGVFDHLERPLDSYRRAAQVVRSAAPTDEPVVASGYLYLETSMKLASTRAFPTEQAVHPGWRAEVPLAELRSEVDTLPASFIWVGERQARELRVLRERYRATPLFMNDRAAVVRMER
ncbi:MAG: glycosyltransferase 87 family protein [Thermoanaerobaculia bacterium]